MDEDVNFILGKLSEVRNGRARIQIEPRRDPNDWNEVSDVVIPRDESAGCVKKT